MVVLLVTLVTLVLLVSLVSTRVGVYIIYIGVGVRGVG